MGVVEGDEQESPISFAPAQILLAAAWGTNEKEEKGEGGLGGCGCGGGDSFDPAVEMQTERSNPRRKALWELW